MNKVYCDWCKKECIRNVKTLKHNNLFRDEDMCEECYALSKRLIKKYLKEPSK